MSATRWRSPECYDKVTIQFIVQTRILRRIKGCTINDYVRTKDENQDHSG